jgi:hypothetical protein
MGNTEGDKAIHKRWGTTEEQASAKAAWLRKEVPEGKPRKGFWVDLAEKSNKAFEHWGVSASSCPSTGTLQKAAKRPGWLSEAEWEG